MRRIISKLFFVILFFFGKNLDLTAQTGTALNFDGVNDNVLVPSLSFGTNWTAEAWFRPTFAGDGNWNVIMSQCNYLTPSAGGFVVAVVSNSLFMETPSGAQIITSVTNNVWTHVAVTYNNGIYALYKNGILIGVQTGTFSNASGPFYLGTRNNNTNNGLIDYYEGDIDEVRIWNTTRSQCLIQQYMTCEIPTTATNLVANYHFNQCGNLLVNLLNSACGTLDDVTGNGHNGTLSLFTLGLIINPIWVAGTCPAQGLTTPASASTATINVTGNGNTITDGSTSPTTVNHTDFGTSSSRTFVIQNTGTQTLNVGTAVFTGTNANQFSVTVIPSSILAATNGSTSFVVTFTPTSVGTKTAVLHIYNSECTKTIFDFVISATAYPNGLDFDGVNDHVNFGNNAATVFGGTLPYTIEAWVKRKSGTSGKIAGHLNSGVTASWFIMVNPDGSFGSYRNTTPFMLSSAPNLIPEDVWTHIATTYNSPNLTIWVNGVSVGSMAIGSQPGTTTPLILGGALSAGTPTDFFGGEIDEFKIWNIARNASQISSGMVAELVGNEANLVAYYHFNKGDPSGTNTIYNTVSSLPTGITGTLTNFALTGCNSNWVCGAPAVGGCPNQQEMTLTGNSVNIVSGTSTVTTTNFSDFGTLATASALTRTFVIKNNGALTLSITASNLSGSGASNFSIASLPAASVVGGGTTAIVITFSPASLGLKNATLSITNNDCDENPYVFALAGTGALPAAALSFDGNKDVINTTDPVIGLSDFTIEGWMKPNGLTGGFLVSSRYGEGFQTGDWFTLGYGGGYVNMEIAECGNGSSNYISTFTSTQTVTTGAWSHFAVVRSGGFYSMYINGNLSATYTEIASHNLNNSSVNPSNILNIGGWVQNNCCWFNGSLDEIRIWKTARTQCEIQSFMNCEIPTTATNLFSNYHFNQGADGLANPTINTLIDASASAYTGTLNVYTGTINPGFVLTGTTSNWIAPGAVISGNSASVAALIEIDVLGNSTSIPDGSSSSSTANFTDFNGVASRSFVIQNTVSGGTLVITTPTIVGTNANQFSITTLPATSISGIGSSTFVVTFIPNSIGVKNATITISSNDCNESLYDFVISATATPASALSFDGTDDAITNIPNVVLNNQSFTVEFWAKRAVNAGNDLIVSQGGASPNIGLHTGFLGANFVFAFWANDLFYANPDLFWHHWACVYKAGAPGIDRFIYRDGILVASDNSASNYLGTGTLAIGSFVGADNFGGDLDEVRVWNVARTQCEIQTYMNCEIPTTATNLLVNFHLNQGIPGGSNASYTTAIDAANGNNGTLGGFTLSGPTSNWINPGAFASGYTTTAVPTATLALTGNAIIIPMGSTTSTNNFTDFGSASTRTFVANNVAASGTLYINSVTLSGGNASDFTLTTFPNGSLTASGSSNFVITFTPTALGTRTAIVTVNSSDCTSPNYSFVITASASPASALAFDGVDDYVDLGNTSNLKPTAALTAEFWAYKANWTTGSVTCISNQTSSGYRVAVITTNLTARIYANSSFWPITIPTSSVSPGWHHMALTYNGQIARFYLDGVEVGHNDLGAVYPITYSGNNTLLGADVGGGALPSGSYFDGKLDEMRVWNVARTQCEIQTYMNCEIPTTATGLLANYHFNQGIPSGSNTVVTTLTDATASNTGTLMNMALTGAISNWVSPSQITNNYTLTSPPAATLIVTGNSSTINAGSTITGTNNFTDFATATTHTFVAQNIGTGTLYINNVYFTGANAAQFTFTSNASGSITTLGSSTFGIIFTPTAVGSSSAIVNFPSNDCANPNYSFVITASASPASALNFDGTNDQVLINNTTALDNIITGVFSFEAWVNPSLNKLNTIISKGHGGYVLNGGEYIFQLNASNQLAFFHSDVNGWKYSSGTVPLNAWSHVAVTFDGSYLKFYINGFLDATKTCTPSLFTAGNNSVYIGRQGYNCNCNFFQGGLDEIRIWTVPRTECEILQYMNCEIPTTATGLLANYHFNQGLPSGPNATVTSLTDATGINNGALTNFSLSFGNSSSNWINPGGVISGSVTPAVLNSTLIVSGNSNSITPGSTSPNLTDYTDFGTATTRTFVVTNTGSGTLHIGYGLFTGANAANFLISTIPSTLIAGGLSSSLVVTFSPTALGTSSAVLTIMSSDCSNPNYSFVITASASPASALSFDGTNDFIDIPASTGINSNFSTNRITMEGWFYPTSTNTVSVPMLVGEAYTGDGNVLFQMSMCSATLRAGFFDGLWKDTITTVALNTWQHFASTYDQQKIRIYVNGILVASKSFTNPLPSGTENWYIGKRWDNPDFFEGNMDEIRIWNLTRSQCEIQDNMNCEIATTAPGLIANYHFNQGVPSGSNSTYTILTDAAGANTGTLSNFSLTGPSSNWISPGAVTSNSTCPIVTYPEIDVQGNSLSIVNSATLSNPANFTQFNNAFIGSSFTRTFVILNTGSANLNITSYSLSGINASDFTIIAAPASVVAPSGSTSIVVTFTPATIGTKTATLNIINDDCDENTFSFTIEGKGIMAAAALNFDGLNDRVTVNDFNLGTGDFTMETWIQPNAFTVPDMYILTNRLSNFAGAGNWFNLAISANRFQIELGQASTISSTVYISTSTLSATNWYHVAVVRTGLEYKLYVNGILETIAYDPSARNISGNFTFAHIGGWPENGSGRWFNGKIDELRVWNVARSQCDLLTFMNTEIITTPAGLIANYHFNEGLVNSNNAGYPNLPDFSTSANTGTLTSFALTGTLSNWVTPGAVTSNVSAPSVPTASILVTGNSLSITPGSTSTSTNNFTDFGISTTRTFVIQNSGTGTVYVDAPVTLSGGNAADFSITGQPSSSVTTGTTNFAINFIPTAIGTRTAIVTVNSSDCTFPNYSFVISGTAVQGEALHFDGINDYANTPVFNTQNTNVTLQSKVFWSGTTFTNQIIAYNGSSSISGYGYFLGSASNALSILYGGGATQATSYSLTPNQWTSLSLVIDNSNTYFYVNGVLTFSGNIGLPAIATTSFNIGANELLAENFNGKIDEVLLWNKALTSCEIQAYLTCEVATSSPSLIANYHFNQGIADGTNTLTTLADASGNNHTLNLFNFSLTGSSSNWVNQGAVVSGSSCPAFVESDITVLGNGNTINLGDITPSLTDDTDFGNVCVGANLVRTYTITNTGTETLSVNSMTMSGAAASLYTIGALSPASPIGIGSQAIFTIGFAPTITGVQTATLTISNNACDESIYYFAVTASVNTAPSVTANISNSVVCAGTSITLSGAGADTYTWTGGITNGVSFIPSANQTYTLSGTNTLSGCSNTNLVTQALTVNAIPSVTVSSPTQTICSNLAATLTASGANTYTWNPGVLTGGTITPSPLTNTTYTLVGTNTAGCTSTNTSTQLITVNITPTISATSVNTAICAGASATLSVNGAATYSWFPAAIAGGTITVNPLTTTNYTAVGYGNTGCISSNSVNTTVTINALPTVTANTTQSVICNGFTTTVFGSGANTYSWTGSVSNNVAFTPSTTLTYTVNGTNTLTGCTSTNLAIQSITVNPTPTITASLTNSVVCFGGSSTLSAGGASSYTWQPGAITSSATIQTPTSTTIYSVSGTSTAGCVANNTVNLTLTVNPLPIVGASTTNSVICSNFTTSVNGSGADTYTWTGGIFNGVAFTPSATLSYTVNGTNTLTGCTSTNSAVQSITVNTTPTITASASNSILCFGGSSTLSAAGASSYTWQPGTITNSTTIQTPTSTSSYSVSGTSSAGCVANNTVNVTVTVNALPNVSAATTNSIICNSFTTSVIGGGADTYTWTGGVFNNLAFTPSVTLSYTVNGTNTLTGCSSTNSAVQNITVNPLPIVGASTTNSVICSNFTTSVNGSGADTYTWTGGIFNGVAFTPSASLSYTVNGTNTLTGCSSTNSAVQSITVNTTPTITASASNSVLCFGGSSTLSALGASNYTWQPGTITSSTTIQTPTSTSSYSVSGTSSAGCVANNTVSLTVTVNLLPIVGASSTNSIICSGYTTSVNGSSADTYTWTGGIFDGVAFTPSASLSYTVNGTNTLTGCTSTNSAVQSITVNTTPTITASASNSVLCFGESSTLSAFGASSYTWQPGTIINSVTVETPSTTTVYSVSGTSSAGCIANNTANITVTVNPLPIVGASTTNSVICSGYTTSVNGSGADTYTWTSGVLDGVAFTPSATLSYTVNGTNALTGCTSTNSAVQSITVNTTPTITASASNSVLCFGESSTLSAAGAATYTWRPGTIINSVTVETPAITTIYSVTGTSSAGCVANNTVNLTVTVNPLPIVGATTTNSVICLNFTTSVNGSGADTYTWSGGITDGITFTPSATQSYSVNGTNTITGCTSTNTAIQTITVNALPTVSIAVTNSVICDGLSVLLNASGADTYTWYPGTLNGTTITPSPTITTQYTLTGTSLEGCTNTNVALQSISVNTLPIINALISNSVICLGSNITINGNGADTYTISNGILNNVAFSPTSNATYTVTGTNLAGCTNTNLATISLTVNPLPTINILVTDSVLCFGDSTSLLASGALTYTWSSGVANGNLFAPATTDVFTVTATDQNSCVNKAATSITVNALPSVTITSTQDKSCIGQSQTLTAIGADTYTWNTSAVSPSILIVPFINSTFTLSATDLNSCVNTATFTQEVNTCEILVYSGVSVNNDGINDVMTIQNIESFPNNNVSIFNRWGNEMFSIKGYNNKDKAWPLSEDTSKLTAGTYFYIIDLGNGAEITKGWVELTKD